MVNFRIRQIEEILTHCSVSKGECGDCPYASACIGAESVAKLGLEAITALRGIILNTAQNDEPSLHGVNQREVDRSLEGSYKIEP